MSLYLDTQEDSEIRIAAYKALMECPSDAVIDRIKRTLETEEVNQVKRGNLKNYLCYLMLQISPVRCRIDKQSV